MLAVGIGSLQIMLDKGQEDNWFGSRFIVTLCGLTVVDLTGLIIRELTAKPPEVLLVVLWVPRYERLATHRLFLSAGRPQWASFEDD